MPARAVETGHARPRFAAFEQDRALALGIDHEQTRRKLGRRAGARERRTRKIERARGQAWIDGAGHGRALCHKEAPSDRVNLAPSGSG